MPTCKLEMVENASLRSSHAIVLESLFNLYWAASKAVSVLLSQKSHLCFVGSGG